MLCNEEMRKSILPRLQGYRYEHSLGVERAGDHAGQKSTARTQKKRVHPQAFCMT